MKTWLLRTFISIAVAVLIVQISSCGGSDPEPVENTEPVISNFSPQSGPVGTEVTISGMNFDVDASLNIVSFSNTIATVTSATATELIVLVPSGAATGTISVEARGKKAISSQTFTVTATPASTPVVSSFLPTSGKVGTTVVISGSNFSASPASNMVKFNGVVVTVSNASTTQLTVKVPNGGSTGKISVKVGSNTGESVNDFTVIQGQWAAMANYGGNARAYAIGFSIGTKGYIGTGLNFITPYQDFWEYNPDNNAWTQKANFKGGARYKAVGFSINEKGYVGTGVAADGTEMTDFYEYDPSTNTWTQRANFPGTPTAAGFGFVINDKGYLGNPANMYQYDPANNSWAEKEPYEGSAYTHSVAFAIGGKGYVGTGYAVVTGESADFWQYDPAADDWIQKADVPGPARGEGIGFAIGTKGYVGLGIYDFEDIYEYNPSNNTWKPLENIIKPGGIYSAAAFVIGTKAYVGTGNDSNVDASRDFYEFDPTR